MRKPLLAANWKMYKTRQEARDFVKGLLGLLPKGWEDSREIVICPSFTSLHTVGEEISGTGIALGAQNMHWEKEGAFTGEVSPLMLKDAGCRYVIIGHSERRHYFAENDDTVNRKLATAFNYDLIPIMCVGETLREREVQETQKVVTRQVEKGLLGLAAGNVSQLVVAYEPVWAIGTGKNATPDDANQVAQLIREIISNNFGTQVADKVRILYGGSVKPGNIASFMEQPEIDGALVGGASLEPESFSHIVNYDK